MRLTTGGQEQTTTLRAVSYLAPGLPEEYFEFLVQEIGRDLDWTATLEFDPSCSGPNSSTSNPFALGTADIGFLCGPSYLHLAGLHPPSVLLVPALPVFSDSRAGGQPVYFSEVVVRRDEPADGMADLARRSWAYNDPSSLSGYFSVLLTAAERGMERPILAVQSGSHARSLELVAAGNADAAAIDSNTLALARRERLPVMEKLRSVDVLGPYPVQPVVLRAALGTAAAEQIAAALLRLSEHPTTSRRLADFGVERFVAASPENYETLRRELESVRAAGTGESGAQAHWDTIYNRKGETGVSWYQAEPRATLALLADLDVAPQAAVIDLGGGASVVVDYLLDRGFKDLSVLDVSKVALEQARGRLGPKARLIQWLHADIFDWKHERRFDVWHDRAVFHFLVEDSERDAYRDILRSALAHGGHVIIATFAPDGPTTCSGLPVVRYSPEELSNFFAPDLRLVGQRREEHITPGGVLQPFTWVALGRADGGPGAS